MKKLPFTTPLILPEALEIPSNCQYFSIYYCDRQPTWSTGDRQITFDKYYIYQPIVEHFVVAIHLLNNVGILGDDNSPPTHQLIFSQTEEVWLAECSEASDFLNRENAQNLSQTPEKSQTTIWCDRELEKTKVLYQLVNDRQLSAFNSKEERNLSIAIGIVNHLNKFITDELIEKYDSMSFLGDLKALLGLHYFFKILQRKEEEQEKKFFT